MGIPTTTTTNYGVVLGSEESVKGVGICKGVKLEMQRLTVIEDNLPLELGNTDIILGMQWLSSLGYVVVNWKSLAMRFKLGEAVRNLKGELKLSQSGVSLKTLMKALQQEEIGVLVELGSFTASTEKDNSLAGLLAGILQVLKRHQQIFEAPKTPPPA